MDAGRREGLRRLSLLAALVGILAAFAWVWALGESWLMLAWGGYPVVGALILAGRPRNPIGRLMLGIGGLWALSGVVLAQENGAPIPSGLELVATATGFAVWCALIGLVVLFPTGRAETRLGRVLARAVVATAGLMALLALVDPAPLEGSGRPNPLGIEAAAPVTAFLIDGPGFLVVPLLLVLATADLLARRRRSTGAARLQYRWFLFAVAVQLTVIVITYFIAFEGPVFLLAAVPFNLIPAAVGIAVTRYGLYEIDRVISRTVAYALVTASVVATYAVVVTSISRLLPASSALAVAAATLAAAAVFRPVLRRVQAVVDRRFNRERYDAERVVEAFGARLRGATDPEAAAADLLAAVGRALQPGAAGLWVRDSRSGATR